MSESADDRESGRYYFPRLRRDRGLRSFGRPRGVIIVALFPPPEVIHQQSYFAYLTGERRFFAVEWTRGSSEPSHHHFVKWV